MADSEFDIDIPLNLDLAPARATLSQFLQEAAKRGVTVPVSVSTGGGGGQGAPVIPRVAAAEQAAVERAMTAARSPTPMYGGYATGGGPGGGILRTSVDTNDAQIAFRRVRGIFDELKRYIESSHIRIQVDTTSAVGSLATARGGGGVAAAAVAQQIGMSPAATQAFVAQASRGGGSVDDIRASLFAGAQQRLAAVEAAALPGSSVLATGGTQGRRGAGYAYGIPRSPNESPLAGLRYGRAIAGALAVTEISGAAQAYRTGQSQSMLAETLEDARLARAQAKDQMFTGLVGSTLSFFPNILNTPGAPQRELREAQEAVHYRRMRDDARLKTYGVGESSAYRQGYYTGGPHLGEIEAIRARNRNKLDEADREMTVLQGKLDQRTPVRTIYHTERGLTREEKSGGDPVFTGDARKGIEESLNAKARLYADDVQQKKFDIGQAERKRWIMLRAMDRQPSILTAAIEGRTRLAQERAFIADIAGQEDQVRDDTVYLKRQRSQNLLAIQARRTEIIAERFERRDDLDEQSRQSRFRQAGPRYAIDSITDRIVTATARAARQLEKDSDPENAVRRRNLGVQQLREASADYFRSIEFEEVSGGRIAAGRGKPFAGVDRKFKDAEDKIGKSKDGGPGAEDKDTKILEEIDKTLKQMLTKHFRAKAG